MRLLTQSPVLALTACKAQPYFSVLLRMKDGCFPSVSFICLHSFFWTEFFPWCLQRFCGSKSYQGLALFCESLCDTKIPVWKCSWLKQTTTKKSCFCTDWLCYHRPAIEDIAFYGNFIIFFNFKVRCSCSFLLLFGYFISILCSLKNSLHMLGLRAR